MDEWEPELPLGFFGELRRAGYAVRVERLDVGAALRGTPAESWLDQLPAWRRGAYFYSHLTDVLRAPRQPLEAVLDIWRPFL